jgi:hypothetical protein
MNIFNRVNKKKDKIEEINTIDKNDKIEEINIINENKVYFTLFNRYHNIDLSEGCVINSIDNFTIYESIEIIEKYCYAKNYNRIGLIILPQNDINFSIKPCNHYSNYVNMIKIEHIYFFDNYTHIHEILKLGFKTNMIIYNCLIHKNFEIFNFLKYHNYKIYVDNEIFNLIRRNKIINVLDWLVENEKTFYTPSSILSEMLSGICQYGSVEILEWFNNKIDFKNTFYGPPNFSSEIITNICMYGNVEILEWFKNSGYEFKQHIDYIEIACINGHLNILDWFLNRDERIKCNDTIIQDCIENNKIEVLDWFKNKLNYEFYYDPFGDIESDELYKWLKINGINNNPIKRINVNF